MRNGKGEKKELSRAQNRVWNFLSFIILISTFLFFAKNFDLAQPFIIGVFFVAVFVVLFVLRLWVRDNTDKDGHPTFLKR